MERDNQTENKNNQNSFIITVRNRFDTLLNFQDIACSLFFITFYYWTILPCNHAVSSDILMYEKNISIEHNSLVLAFFFVCFLTFILNFFISIFCRLFFLLVSVFCHLLPACHFLSLAIARLKNKGNIRVMRYEKLGGSE